MAANSLQSAFSLGLQSDMTTAATAYDTALATVSGANAEFDIAEPENEHPSPAARSTAMKTAPERVGYLVPVNATFLMHPNFIGRALQAMGMACTTTDNTTYFTHVFKISTDALVPWMTALHKWSGTSDLTRKVTGVRGESLQITADTNRITNVFQGVGLTEGIAAGTETLTAEDPALIKPSTGSVTLNVNATAVTTVYRNNQMTIAQEIERDDRVLHSTSRGGMARLSWQASGTIGGVDIDSGTYAHYKHIKYGGAAGTAPSLVSPTGSITWSFTSSANITGAAVPYSFTVLVPTVAWDLVAPNANGRDLIRADLTWQMLDQTTDPITITLVNNVAEYV